jgi:hypothetical protein
MTAGRLTVADLSTWFSRPYATVRSWTLEGRQPWGPNGEEAFRLLAILEKRIADGHGFPMPLNLSPSARREYMTRQRRDNTDRISKTHFAA